MPSLDAIGNCHYEECHTITKVQIKKTQSNFAIKPCRSRENRNLFTKNNKKTNCAIFQQHYCDIKLVRNVSSMCKTDMTAEKDIKIEKESENKRKVMKTLSIIAKQH